MLLLFNSLMFMGSLRLALTICNGYYVPASINTILLRGGSRGGEGGGAWGAHAPPFGTERALNTEIYRVLSARSYFDTAHISR